METTYFKTIAILAMLAVLFACSDIDIKDDLAVMKYIQGTWVGKEIIGMFSRNIKVSLIDNRFEGCVQLTDSITEPTWTLLPIETGTFSISSVQEKLSGTGKYRSFIFFILGRCCGDNSLTTKTLSELMTYDQREGLLVGGREPMTRVQ